jgi:hypothetical protein
MAKFLACILLILLTYVIYEIVTTTAVGCSKLEYWREVYTIC